MIPNLKFHAFYIVLSLMQTKESALPGMHSWRRIKKKKKPPFIIGYNGNFVNMSVWGDVYMGLFILHIYRR